LPIGRKPDHHSAFAVRRLLDDIRHRPDILTTGRQALEDARDDKQYRRPDADGAVARKQAARGGTHCHQHDRDHQHPLAPEAATERAEDHSAERTHDKRRCQRAEGGDQVNRADAVAGVEHLRDRGGDVAVDPEVVPLHEIADRSALDGPTRHLGVSDLDLVAGPFPPARSVHGHVRYPLPSGFNATVIKAAY
jgi:hypothetical protein